MVCSTPWTIVADASYNDIIGFSVDDSINYFFGDDYQMSDVNVIAPDDIVYDYKYSNGDEDIYISEFQNDDLEDDSISLFSIPPSVDVSNWINVYKDNNSNKWETSYNLNRYIPWNNFGMTATYVSSGSTANIAYQKYLMASGSIDYELNYGDYYYQPNTGENVPIYDEYAIAFKFTSNVNISGSSNATNDDKVFNSYIKNSYVIVEYGSDKFTVPTDGRTYILLVDRINTFPIFKLTPVTTIHTDYHGIYFTGNNQYPPDRFGSSNFSCSYKLTSFEIFGCNFPSSGSYNIVDSIKTVQQQLSSIYDMIYQRFDIIHGDLVTNNNYLLNIDTHNVAWYAEIANRITGWGGNINTTLINWFATTNQNLLSFYNRNHNDLMQIHTDLTQYDSTAGGLDGANEQFKTEMDSYKDNTDTSVQYSKITDDIFELDTNFFTSLASTATFFSSLVTMAFNSLGDFAVALTMFLVLMFVSMVLGIASKVKGGD